MNELDLIKQKVNEIWRDTYKDDIDIKVEVTNKIIIVSVYFAFINICTYKIHKDRIFLEQRDGEIMLSHYDKLKETQKLVKDKTYWRTNY